MLSQLQSAVYRQAAKLFQQHWRQLKVNYDLNSAFENAGRLLEQKRIGRRFQNCATNIIKPSRVSIYRKKYF
jgi:hypothetical protein